MIKQFIFEPCPACDGQGRWHGCETNDPGERAKWHPCGECGGTGSSPFRVEEGDDE